MNEALERLAQQFEAWRAPPKRSRQTPEHLVKALADLIGQVPSTQLMNRLGIGHALVQRAMALKAQTVPNTSPSIKENTEQASLTFIPLRMGEPSLATQAPELPEESPHLVSASLSMAGATVHLKAYPDALCAVLMRLSGGVQS
jgi:hypothetical protein